MADKTKRELKAEEQTRLHIEQVRKLMNRLIQELIIRAEKHDKTKLEEPEVSIFNEFTEKLSGITYGSAEYKKCLEKMKPALDHHYRHNRHHPENHIHGIEGMNLIDIFEMIADWKSATLRHDDGNIRKSIEINKERFDISDQLVHILMNTVELFDE